MTTLHTRRKRRTRKQGTWAQHRLVGGRTGNKHSKMTPSSRPASYASRLVEAQTFLADQYPARAGPPTTPVDEPRRDGVTQTSLPPSKEFPEHKEWNPEQGKHQRYQSAECACGETIRFPIIHAPLPPEGVAKRLVRAGWRAGSNRGKDLCPRCITIERNHRSAATNAMSETTDEEKAVTQAGDAGAAAEATPGTPAAPSPVVSTSRTREDNRRVVGALSEAYDTDRQCYRAGHRDDSVAVGLGVPVQWVTELREQMFGPDDAEEVLLLMEQMERFEELVAERQDSLREAARAVTAALDAEADRIVQRLTGEREALNTDFDRRVTDLRDLLRQAHERVDARLEEDLQSVRESAERLRGLHEQVLART